MTYVPDPRYQELVHVWSVGKTKASTTTTTTADGKPSKTRLSKAQVQERLAKVRKHLQTYFGKAHSGTFLGDKFKLDPRTVNNHLKTRSEVTGESGPKGQMLWKWKTIGGE
jgi:hypothetical protein